MARKIQQYNLSDGELKSIKAVKKRRRRRSHTQAQREKLVEYLMFGVTQKMSYNNTIEINPEIAELVSKVAEGTNSDIEFLSKTLIYARTNGAQKELPIFGLVVLSASPVDEAKKLFRKIFPQVIINAGDLKLFVDIINSRIIRGHGKAIQKALQEWLADMPVYEAIKYSLHSREQFSINDRRRDSVTLGDIIYLSHIKPASDDKNGMYKWLRGQSIAGVKTPGQIVAFERLRHLPTYSEDITKIVSENALPLEAIEKMIGSNKEAWKSVFLQAPFHTLIDNINSFSRYKVLEDKKCQDHFIKLFSNTTTIRKSNNLPYKFMEVYDSLDGSPARVLRAVEEAIASSYVSLPEINKKVAIVIDQSKSPGETMATSNPPVTVKNAAAGLAAIISKIAKETYIIPFAARAKTIKVNPEDSTISIANKIIQQDVGDALNHSSGFKELIKEKLNVDTVIFINDRIEWNRILRDSEAGDLLTSYVNSTNEEMQLLFLTAATSRNNVSHSLSRGHFFFGWSDYMLKYLFYLLAEQSDFVEAVDSLKIQ